MTERALPYLLPLLAVTGLLLFIAWHTLHQRPAPGRVPLIWLTLGTAGWLLTYALRLVNSDLPQHLFWMKVQFVCIVGVPVAWLIFVLDYGRPAGLSLRRLLVPLLIIPTLTLLLVWTNEAHGWFYRSLTLETDGPLPVLHVTYGPGFWLHALYLYVLFAAGLVVLYQTHMRQQGFYRRQSGTVMLAALVPWLASLLDNTGLNPARYCDLTPFAFAFTGLALTRALFSFKLFDIVPVARDLIVENIADGVIVLDDQNRIMDLNSAAQRILGLSSLAGLGQPVEQVLRDQSPTAKGSGPEQPVTGLRGAPGSLRAELAQVLSAGCWGNEGYCTEIVAGFEPEEEAYELRILPLRDQHGRISGRLVLLRDIGEQRRARQTIQRSEQLYRTLFEQANDAIFLETENDEIVDVNRRACEMLGYSREELLAMKVKDLLPSEIRPPADNVVKEELLHHKGQPFEAVNLHRDGHQIPVEVTVTPLVDSPAPGMALCIVRDISERKRAEAIEREQRILAEALRDTATALASTLNFDEALDTVLAEAGKVVPHDAGTVMLIENGVAHVVRSRGYTERGLIDPTFRVSFPVTEAANLRQMYETGRPLAIPDTGDYPGWVDIPEARWIRSNAAAPIRFRGEVIGFLHLDSATPGFFSQADADRLQAFADQAGIAIANARLFSSLQEANEQLRAALRAKDEMVQNVSHELRTPLSLILGYVELLLEEGLGSLTAEQLQAVEVMHRHARQLSFMVNRLLTLQTFQSERLHRVPLELGSWLAQVAESWQLRAARADIHVRFEGPIPGPVVLADMNFLAQVLDNLLENAFKFGPQGSEVVIRTWSERERALIAVSDQRIGIEPDQLSRIFERFYQADGSSTRQYGGMGIGLALCRLIVEAHGGQIWAESAGKGQGSTFYIALPLSELS